MKIQISHYSFLFIIIRIYIFSFVIAVRYFCIYNSLY